MAFKSLATYNEEKNGIFFVLPNDGDSAKVTFLYESAQDVLVADVHYIKSSEYSGYVHCPGPGCPACRKGIGVRTKLFIPLFNYDHDRIEFWDRTTYFEPQLNHDIFNKFPNPSEYVFEVIRHGEARSTDTTYEIVGRYKNSSFPYAKILADNNATMPEYYENICKTVSIEELSQMLAGGDDSSYPTTEYSYVPTPRGSQSTYTPPSNMVPEPTINVAPPVVNSAVGAVPDLPPMEAPAPKTEEVTAAEELPTMEAPVAEEDTSGSSDIGDIDDAYF